MTSAHHLLDMARILEINDAGEVLFEMVVHSDVSGVLLYRSERIELYPRG